MSLRNLFGGSSRTLLASMPAFHEYTAKDIHGRDVKIGDVAGGKVALVVNVASQCGFTPVYKQLQSLFERFRSRGFVVLGFPCNQFGGQEPADESAIEEFTCSRYSVTFPMFAKVDVNGDTAHPLWKFLTVSSPGLLGTEFVKWNFTAFLVDQYGKVVQRFAPSHSLESLAAPEIEALLSKGSESAASAAATASPLTST